MIQSCCVTMAFSEGGSMQHCQTSESPLAAQPSRCHTSTGLQEEAVRVYSLTPPEDWQWRGSGASVEATRLSPLPRGSAPAFRGTLLSFEVDARGEARGSALYNCMRLRYSSGKQASSLCIPRTKNIGVGGPPPLPPSPGKR